MQRSWIALLLLAVWMASPAAAETIPAGPTPQDDHTLFLAHLNGPGMDADFAKGNPKPAKFDGSKPVFTDGKFGSALMIPGPIVYYSPTGNINPLKGTLDFWLMDADFDHSSWGGRRYLFHSGGWEAGRSWCIELILEKDLLIWRQLYTDAGVNGGVLLWGGHVPAGKWLHVVASWDVEAGDARLLYDGRESVRTTYKPEDIKALKSLIEACPPLQLMLGSEFANKSTVLLDEFRISDNFRAATFTPPAAEPTILSSYGDGPRSDYVPTRQVVTPHIPWANPYYRGKTRILVLEDWTRLRETVELAQRLDVEYDVVPLTTGGDTRGSFGKMADYEKEMIAAKLAKNPEVVILGALSSKWFPDDTWKLLSDKVAGGMGLVWPGMDPKEERLVELLKQRVDPPPFLRNGPPLTPLSSMLGGSYSNVYSMATNGQGRVIGTSCNDHHRRYSALIPIYYAGDEEFHFALLTRMVLWAAKKEPDVSVVALADGDGIPAMHADRPADIMITSKREAPFNARLDVVVRDTSAAWDMFENKRLGTVEIGRATYPELTRSTQRVTLAPGVNKVSVKLPGLPRGYYSVDAQLYDEQNRAIEWDSAFVRVISNPTIRGMALDKDSYENGNTAVCTATVDGETQNARIDWELRDLFSRLLARGSVPLEANAKSARVEAPVANALTRVLELTLKTVRGNDVVQTVRKPLMVALHRNRDFSYLLYGGIPWLDAELGMTGVISGAWPGNEARMEASDIDMFFWCDVPGFNSHAPRQVKVRQPCLTDPATRAKAEEYFAQIGPLCRQEEPFGIIATDEWEYMSYLWAKEPGEDLCHSPTCLAGFREFLKRDYAIIEALNREWETTYKAWSEVEPILAKDAAARTNKSPLVDAWRFNEWKLADYLTFCEQSARKQFPGARVGMSGTRSANGYTAYDYWRLMNASHMIANYGGVMPRQSQSFQTPQDFVTMWRGYTSNFREPAGELVWEALASDFDAYANYAYYADFGPFMPDYTEAPGARDMARVYRETQRGLSTLLKGAKRLSDPIAIHYSQVSAHVATLGLVPKLDLNLFEANQTGLTSLLTDCGYEFRYVSYEEIEKGVLQKEGFHLLILPMSTAISDKEAEQIRAFVAAGGTVMGDAWTGLFDGHGKPRGKGVLDDLFGIARDKPASDLSLLPITLPERVKLTGRTFGEQQAIHAESGIVIAGGEALAHFGPDKPALIRKADGKGQALFTNLLFTDYDIFRAGGANGEVGTVTRAKGERRINSQSLYQGILSLAGLKPVIVIENATPPNQRQVNAEVIRYSDGEGEYVMLWTGLSQALDSKERASNEVTVHLPATGHVYDVRQGKYAGRTDAIKMTLTEGEPAILALLPDKVEKIAAAFDKTTVKPGTVLLLSMSNATPAAKAQRRVYHVEVMDPKGALVLVHTMNVNAPKGSATVAVPLALDAAAGEWKCAVTDAASGVKAETRFVVQPAEPAAP